MSYISQTKEFIAQAKSLIDSGAIEARVRENFASYLRTMFPPDTKWVDDRPRVLKSKAGRSRKREEVLVSPKPLNR